MSKKIKKISPLQILLYFVSIVVGLVLGGAIMYFCNKYFINQMHNFTVPKNYPDLEGFFQFIKTLFFGPIAAVLVYFIIKYTDRLMSKLNLSYILSHLGTYICVGVGLYFYNKLAGVSIVMFILYALFMIVGIYLGAHSNDRDDYTDSFSEYSEMMLAKIYNNPIYRFLNYIFGNPIILSILAVGGELVVLLLTFKNGQVGADDFGTFMGIIFAYSCVIEAIGFVFSNNIRLPYLAGKFVLWTLGSIIIDKRSVFESIFIGLFFMVPTVQVITLILQAIGEMLGNVGVSFYTTSSGKTGYVTTYNFDNTHRTTTVHHANGDVSGYYVSDHTKDAGFKSVTKIK